MEDSDLNLRAEIRTTYSLTMVRMTRTTLKPTATRTATTTTRILLQAQQTTRDRSTW